MVIASFSQDVLEAMEQEPSLQVEKVTSTVENNVTLYHTVTHEPRKMAPYVAMQALKKRFPANYEDAPEFSGKPVFSTTPSGTYIMRRTHPCLLNPEHPENARYSKWGFAVCHTKFVSPFHAQRHMERKHRVEWETIKHAREEERIERERAIQEAMVAALQRPGPGRPSKKR
jgi:hypothetical protein